MNKKTGNSKPGKPTMSSANYFKTASKKLSNKNSRKVALQQDIQSLQKKLSAYEQDVQNCHTHMQKCLDALSYYNNEINEINAQLPATDDEATIKNLYHQLDAIKADIAEVSEAFAIQKNALQKYEQDPEFQTALEQRRRELKELKQQHAEISAELNATRSHSPIQQRE